MTTTYEQQITVRQETDGWGHTVYRAYLPIRGCGPALRCDHTRNADGECLVTNWSGATADAAVAAAQGHIDWMIEYNRRITDGDGEDDLLSAVMQGVLRSSGPCHFCGQAAGPGGCQNCV